LDETSFPSAMPEEAGHRLPEPRRCPEVRQQQEARCIACALGVKRDRPEHRSPGHEKGPRRPERRPKGPFGAPKGPLSPETGLGLRETYVPSVYERESKVRYCTTSSSWPPSSSPGPSSWPCSSPSSSWP